MSNSYVITGLSYSANTSDPMVTITGTVNGVLVSVSCWYSVLQPKMASAILFEDFVGPLLLAAYNALQTTTLSPPSSSWSI